MSNIFLVTFIVCNASFLLGVRNMLSAHTFQRLLQGCWL